MTNESLHADTHVESRLSGTTSISCLIRGRMVFISNVGDSRAIIVSKDEDGGKSLKAMAMSSDHTPYRKDERFRILKYGARILSMGQLMNSQANIGSERESFLGWGDLILGEDIDEGGDPPRVWSPNGMYGDSSFSCGVLVN